jgi:hypothetical protein
VTAVACLLSTTDPSNSPSCGGASVSDYRKRLIHGGRPSSAAPRRLGGLDTVAVLGSASDLTRVDLRPARTGLAYWISVTGCSGASFGGREHY